MCNREERGGNKENSVGDFLTLDCGGKRAALDKSVLFRTLKGFGYEFGAGFRGKNLTKLDKNIF